MGVLLLLGPRLEKYSERHGMYPQTDTDKTGHEDVYTAVHEKHIIVKQSQL